ncbi:hypothetical protein GGD56_003536 [Rhizobium mongolense]|uniref:Uncharacterized protein n=1 Tax=Rhizobium mongolense TaxID=57676 RepID=A0ABR6IPS4_9HYPH|nr:hypothetical protein [Rhizobium mongolense]
MDDDRMKAVLQVWKKKQGANEVLQRSIVIEEKGRFDEQGSKCCKRHNPIKWHNSFDAFLNKVSRRHGCSVSRDPHDKAADNEKQVDTRGSD